jgi:hypothetical protein
MKYFYDGNIRPTPKLSDEETPPLIFPSMDLGKDFVSAESIKNMVTRRNGHCALLNTNIFRKRKPDGTVQDADRICRYCTGTFLPHNLESHEAECKPSFAEGSKRQRVRRYREIHPSKAVKEFSAQHSRYQVNFSVYDWETRTDKTGRHIPFSYAIVYLNIFCLKKSRVYMFSSQDPKEVIAEFLHDIAEVMAHHHAIQSVDFADAEEKAKAKIPEDGVCPFASR